MTPRQALLSDADAAFVDDLIERANTQYVVPRFQNLSEADAATAHSIDAVTIADTEAEAFISTSLRHRFPGCGVVGEEATKDGQEEAIRALTFSVDPVDGTRQFALGKTHFGTIVSASIDGVIAHNWILCPLLKLKAYAALGQGAQLNGERISWVGQTFTPAQSKLRFYPKYGVYDAMIAAYPKEAWQDSGPAQSIAAEACLALADTSRGHVAVSGHFSMWDHAGPMRLFIEAGGDAWRADGDANLLRPSGKSKIVYATNAGLVKAARATLETLDV